MPSGTQADKKFLNIPNVLAQVDATLRASLAARHSSPFIAHHFVSDEGREAIAEWMDLGGLGAYLRMAEKWPALSAWALADFISQHYGEESSNAVYIHIEDFLGNTHLPNNERPILHKSFREACVKLGLALPARKAGEFVRDYIIQAGASFQQLEALASAFVAAEEVYGRPPIDDMTQLNTWEDESVMSYLPVGLTRLRDIILFDATGYHAAVYLKLREGGKPASPFENKFKEAIDSVLNDPKRRKKRQAILQTPPYLSLVDASICLINPSGGDDIKIKLSGKEFLLPRNGILPVPEPYPVTVEWKPAFSNEKGISSFLTVIPKAENSLIVFHAESGKQRPVRIETHGNDDVIELDLGEYAFFSKQQFNIENIESHSLGAGYLLYHSVVKSSELSFGLKKIKLIPTPKTAVLISGVPVLKSQKLSLLPSPLKAFVTVPTEIQSEKLDLIIEHSSLPQTIRHEINLAEGACDYAADLDSLLPLHGPLGILRISVVLRGQERSLASAAAHYWPGLKALKWGSIFEGPVPTNFDSKHSKHVIVTDKGYLALPADSDYSFAKLVFRQAATFEIVNPSVSVSLVNADLSTRIIPKGSEIPIGDNLEQSIIVRCGDTSASLDICGDIEENCFFKGNQRRLSLSSLRKEGCHDEVRIIVKGLQHPLFRVVHSFEPKNFTALLANEGSYIVSFKTHIEIDAVKVVAANLNFPTEKVILEVGQNSSCPQVSFHPTQGNETGIELRFQSQHWQNGIWLLDLSLRDRSQQRWRPMRTLSGDLFALCLNVSDRKFDTSAPLPENTQYAYHQISQALCTSYANDISLALLPMWKTLGGELAKRGSLENLLESTILMPPAETRASWMPRTHALEVKPDLYAAPINYYSGLLKKIEDGAQDLGCLSLCESLPKAVEQLNIAPAFWPAFIHFALRPEAPGKFQFEKYESFLSQLRPSDPFGNFWDISRNELLSLGHHNSSWRRGAARLRNTLKDIDAGEVNHLIVATTLLRRVNFLDSVSLAAKSEKIELDDAIDHVYGDLSICEKLPAFLSAIALESRRGSSQVEKLWNDLSHKTGVSHSLVIKRSALVIRANVELFAFYLLMWELILRGNNERS